MKLLFDTHAFIWWDGEPSKLSSKVLALCEDRTNELLLSIASTWEMQIKFQLGKLEFDTVYFLYTLAAFVAARRTGNFRAGISAAFWSAMIASSSYWRRQLLIPLPKKPAIRLTVSD